MDPPKYRNVLGLSGKILLVGPAGVAFHKKSPEAATCWIESVPVRSKREQQLASAELMSNTACNSAITYLRKSKKYCTGAERMRKLKRNISANPSVY